MNLEVWIGLSLDDRDISLVPFHNFSPVLKASNLSEYPLPRVRIFDFVCSPPLLEDLTVINHSLGGSDWDQTKLQPSTSPVLTGALELGLPGGIEHTTRSLLNLPNGLHFRKLVCKWGIEENALCTRALVKAYSNTLECVDLRGLCGMFLQFLNQGLKRTLHLLDLSNTPKLKEVTFRVKTLSVVWMTRVLRTIAPNHQNSHKISIRILERHRPIADPTGLKGTFEEPFYRQWMDLDRLLVKFWESRGIRPKVLYDVSENEKEATCKSIGCLFPEITERGIIELVNCVESYDL